jgi:hypothetical protein
MPAVVGASVSQTLEPGQHKLHVRALEPGKPPLMPLELNVEPCTRYSFVARDTSSGPIALPLGESPIPGCKH